MLTFRGKFEKNNFSNEIYQSKKFGGETYVWMLRGFFY